jgi:hypothetical protein
MVTSQERKAAKTLKKGFSKFTRKEVFEYLGITHLLPWDFEVEPIAPSDLFKAHLDRIACFDLEGSEEGKKLIIDAVLTEAIQPFRQTLKIWKGINLEGDIAQGEADYLIAVNKGYFDRPVLCVIEAKRDDFYQGLSQCLIEMKTCQFYNQQTNPENTSLGSLDLFGIVTNGEAWKYFKLNQNAAYETLLHSISDVGDVLGRLHYLLKQCENSLKN